MLTVISHNRLTDVQVLIAADVVCHLFKGLPQDVSDSLCTEFICYLEDPNFLPEVGNFFWEKLDADETGTAL